MERASPGCELHLTERREEKASNLVEHEAHLGLLAEAAAQAVEDLQAEPFVVGRVVARVDVRLDLNGGFF